MIDFLENGNIKNSVNYPAVSFPRTTALRITVLHRNIPAVLSKISSAIAEEGINISHLYNASKGNYAYTMMDIDAEAVSEHSLEKIASVDGVIRVRVID